MEAESLNDRAMSLLAKGEFDAAQELFYLNKRQNPCRQTYNNLGSFLYDNGMRLRNGKEVSAVALGKRYVQKAWEYGQDAVVACNLGRIFYEEQDFHAAYRYFSLTCMEVPGDQILYNQAVSLFGLREYGQSYSCLKKIKVPFPEAIPPLLFSMAFSDRNNMTRCLRNGEYREQIGQMDPIQQMVFYYLCGQDLRVIETEKIMRLEWSLNGDEWAIWIDSLIRAGKAEELPQALSRVTEGYAPAYEKRLCRTIRFFCRNEAGRKEAIKRYFNTLCFPQIEPCGYYGCKAHRTPWQ